MKNDYKQVVLLALLTGSLLAAALPLASDSQPSVKSDDVAVLQPEAREDKEESAAPAVVIQVSLSSFSSMLIYYSLCNKFVTRELRNEWQKLFFFLRRLWRTLRAHLECSRVTRFLIYRLLYSLSIFGADTKKKKKNIIWILIQPLTVKILKNRFTYCGNCEKEISDY